MSESSFRKAVLAASGTALLFVSGCYSGPESEPGMVVAQPVVPLGQAGYAIYPSDTYQLRPNDVINVTVFREPELSLNAVPVSATGEISMPLLGFDAGGGDDHIGGWRASSNRCSTPSSLRFPDVSINIVQYGSHLVTVEGSVTAPGIYNFSPGTKLSGAMALANGPSRIADQDDVAVFRETPDGMAIAKFDYVAIQSGTMIDPMLEPGDRIVVGLNNLSQFWQDVLMTLPIFGYFRRF